VKLNTGVAVLNNDWVLVWLILYEMRGRGSLFCECLKPLTNKYPAEAAAYGVSLAAESLDAEDILSSGQCFDCFSCPQDVLMKKLPMPE